MIEALTLERPIGLLLALPFLILLALQFYPRRKHGAVAASDLEFLRRKLGLASEDRRRLRAGLWALLALGIAVLWSEPTALSSRPLFEVERDQNHRNIVLMLDISRSMGVPIGEEKVLRLPGQRPPQRASDSGEEEESRYVAAREALETFVRRFQGERIGLILFSTEPFLARWPTIGTEQLFREVLHENIGRGEVSQLQSYSSLTNINKALDLAREVITSQEGMTGGAVVLLSDAEDDIENIGTAVRNLRNDGIRVYTIGVGIAESVVEALTLDLGNDEGFRVFRADSAAEIEEAYNLVAGLEESAATGGDQGEFETDLRSLVALGFFVLAGVVIVLSDTQLHRSRTA